LGKGTGASSPASDLLVFWKRLTEITQQKFSIAKNEERLDSLEAIITP